MSTMEPNSRNDLIDSLRAVALAGVIIMNMITFSGLAYLSPEMRAEWLGTADRFVWVLIRILVDDKALAAFSFMFGFSFSVILGKAISSRDAAVRFVQRLMVLFMIGLFNALFLFWADILMSYAVLGLILPFAARLPTRVIAGLALALVIAAPMTLALGGYEMPTSVPRGHTESLGAFASPELTDTVKQNWHMIFAASEAAESTLVLRFMTLMGLFLLGLAAGKSGVIMVLAGRRDHLMRLGLMLALVGATMNIFLRYVVEPEGLWVLLTLESPIMALGYLMLIGAALAGASMGWLRRLLAPLGRMTLTGYLTTAISGQALFYGWGLGLIGQVGTLGVLAIASVFYVALIIFAQLWLHFFPFGPWEWLWRSLTNLLPQPQIGRRVAH